MIEYAAITPLELVTIDWGARTETMLVWLPWSVINGKIVRVQVLGLCWHELVE